MALKKNTVAKPVIKSASKPGPAPSPKVAAKAGAVEVEEKEVVLEAKPPVLRKELAESVRDRVFAAGKAVPIQVAEIMVVAYEEVVADSLAEGRVVSLPGYGKFETSDIPGGERRNPSTGEKFMVGPTKRVKFKPGVKLKERVITALMGEKDTG